MMAKGCCAWPVSARLAAVLSIAGFASLAKSNRQALCLIGVPIAATILAAALGKSGVAIFGPTDPARNGPYCDTIQVLRSPAAATTYKRGAAIDASMREVTPAEVFEALRTALRCLV